MKRRFKDLSAAEVLALAVSLEEEDGRLLGSSPRLRRTNYPKAAADLDAMRKERTPTGTGWSNCIGEGMATRFL